MEKISKPEIKNVLAVMSGKGGVGKSTITSLLASGARRKGFKTGILDADITGPSIPMIFGLKGNPEQGKKGILPMESALGIKIMSLNLLLENEDEPVIWRGPLIAGTVKQFWTDVEWGELDYLFVDLPPGTSDVPLTVMQSISLTGLVIVSSPQELAGMIVRKALKMGEKLGIPLLGLIENMTHLVCPRCGQKIEVFGAAKGKKTAENFGIPFLGGLPFSELLAEYCDTGMIERYESDLFEKLQENI